MLGLNENAIKEMMGIKMYVSETASLKADISRTNDQICIILPPLERKF